ncbi:MAG: hypothetical protein WC381_11665, partial [Kiritimatiellia bacterium]
QDRRIIRELGFRGHLKYRVCNKRGALKITEPQHLQSAHTRDALVFALFNWGSAANRRYLFPDCLKGGA